jgi:hypothetical protein
MDDRDLPYYFLRSHRIQQCPRTFPAYERLDGGGLDGPRCEFLADILSIVLLNIGAALDCANHGYRGGEILVDSVDKK